METRVPARLTAAEGRNFGLTVGAAFLVIAAISMWRGHTIAPKLLGGLGAALVVSGIVIPGQLGPTYRAWMGFSRVLSRFTTPVFMGVVYFLVITPTAFVRRLLGGNPMQHSAERDSYWAQHTPRSDPRDMERQF